MNSVFEQGENVAFSANGDDKRNPNAKSSSLAPGGRELGRGGFHPHLNPLPSRERKTILY
jgi:hypothetical protein